MKKQTLILLLIISTVKLSIAQSDTLFNYIEKRMHQCLLDTSGVMGQSFCLSNAVNDWTKELEKYDKLIIAKLAGQLKQDYIESQSKWRAYMNSEIALAEQLEKKYYEENPQMILYPQIATERELNVIKTRVLELVDYLNLISNK
ncbi:MAG: lysozyme inhibitor LprI family protein [Bacteroidia bacterium]